MINHYGRGVRLTRVCKCAEGGGLRGELAGRAKLHAQHRPLAVRLFGSVLYKNKSLQAFTRACTARNWQGQASGAHVGGTEFSTENFVLSFVLHSCRCSCCPCSVVAAVMETTGAGASLVKRAFRIKVAAVGKRKGSVQR